MFLAGCCVKVNEIDEQQSKRKKKKKKQLKAPHKYCDQRSPK